MIPINLKKILLNLKSLEWINPILRSANVYIVGGSIRDAFLGKSIKDIDLIVEGLPLIKIQELLRPYGKVDIVGESFSVIKFKPKGFKGEPYDIATPRMDRKIGQGHKGFEIITDGVDLLTDLKRRDFTINSMAANVDTMELVDPFNGLNDLNNNILRAVDKNAFAEDPLRILRGIGFASRLGFTIEPKTLKLMQENAHLIKEISGERIFEELIKILKKGGDTGLALILLNETNVDKALFNKKISAYTEGFESLDIISFFYVLGLLGDVNPADFLKKRLKGDSKLENDVRTLDKLMELIPKTRKEEDLRFLLFKAFNRAPSVVNAVVLPPKIDRIISDMKSNKIPMRMDDIQLTGEDIIIIGNLKEGPEIGLIKEIILRDALMNKFNWKDRNDSIDYLENLLK